MEVQEKIEKTGNISTNNFRERYQFINVIRGGAALWVAIVHGYGSFSSKVELPEFFGIQLLLGERWSRVPIFFVVSGYCIASSAVNRKPLDFIIARFWALYPKYIIAFILTFFIFYAKSIVVPMGFINQVEDISPFLTQNPIIFWLSNIFLSSFPLREKTLLGQAWSLNYEVYFYFIVFFLLLTGLKSKKLLISLHIVTLFSAIFLIVSPRIVPFPFNLWPQFGLGILCYEYLNGNRNLKSFLGVVMILGIYVCIACSLFYRFDKTFLLNIPGTWCHGSEGILVSLVTFILLCIIKKYDKTLSKNYFSKMFSNVGNLSYSLYLTHTLTLSVFNLLVIKLNVKGYLGWVFLGIYLCASIWFSSIFHKIVDVMVKKVRKNNV